MVKEFPKKDGKQRKLKIPASKNVRIFRKNDLITANLFKASNNLSKFDLDSEKQLFSSDKKLQDLFVKVIEKTTKDSDWIQNRLMYLSRVHENLQTRSEFSQLQKEINSSQAKEYLSEKSDMNLIVTQHMRLRNSI